MAVSFMDVLACSLPDLIADDDTTPLAGKSIVCVTPM
jgi:hypothetical protein